MDKVTLEIMQNKVTKGNEIQNKLFVLRQLKQGLGDTTSKRGLVINITCKDEIKTIKESCYVKELFEPIKDSIIDIVDRQIMMFNLEFEEL